MQDGGGTSAGPTFDLDPAHLEFASAAELPERHLQMLDRLALLYAQIEKAAEFSLPAKIPGHATALANLRGFDKRRRDLFKDIAPPSLLTS